MKPLVSIIVPVYKVEDVLERCLDSLCRQSLANIEIVLVDDASPDRCGKICDAFAAKDNRFRVIHFPENRGVSVARNTGIRLVRAEYLMFVDSDDWVADDFCRDAYECAVKYQADLVFFRYGRVYQNGEVNPNRIVGESGYKTRLEALDMAGGSSCNKLYRKELFTGVLFPAGYYYEDVGTTHKTIFLAEKIYYLNKVLYYYCHREGSTVTLKTKKRFQDRCTMFMQRYRDMAEWGYPADKVELKMQNKALAYCILKRREASDPVYERCLRLLQSSKSVPGVFSWKRKILFLILKYSPSLFEIVCTTFGKKVC